MQVGPDMRYVCPHIDKTYPHEIKTVHFIVPGFRPVRCFRLPVGFQFLHGDACGLRCSGCHCGTGDDRECSGGHGKRTGG